jgi:putative ABC transport system permease protein
MDGAFNDVVLTLSPGAQAGDVIARLDAVLDQYGGLGAIAREDQPSHRFLSEEFRQLQQSARLYPSIFIGVAAFLLNVVITRTVSTQREQIAALKAFGYRTVDVAIHYIKLVSLIVSIGVVCGTLLGIWLGNALSGIYMHFYRFPSLTYLLHPSVVAAAAFITIASAIAGTLHAVWKTVRIPPAQAMRPEQPARYRRTVMERVVPARILSQPARIIARNIERKPLKSFFTIVGIAMACAIMMTGGFFRNTVNYMVDIQFKLSHREDMTVTFVDPASWKSLYELKGLWGVQYAEPFRAVPVRFRFGQRTYRTLLRGIEPGSRLYLLLDKNLKPVELPPSGIVLTEYLGGILAVKPGDKITIEVLEGKRPVREVAVTGFVKEYIGLMGYMNLEALNNVMGDGNVISGVSLAVDEREQQKIYRILVEMPRVAGTVVRKDEIRNFYETQAESILFFTLVATLLAGVIAFGVVYNSARISLAERSRELASLRVLGYTRGEISYILLGELGFLTLAAVPVGFVLGRALCAFVAHSLQSDLWRIPFIMETSTYAQAAAVVIVSASVSGLIVRSQLDHLDLVEVLKTRE